MLEPPPATATARSPDTAATGARSSGSGGAGSLARGRSKWGPVGRRRGRAVSLRSSHYRLWRTPRRLHRKQPPQDEPSLQELCAAGLAVLVLHPCVAGRRHSTTRPPPARGPVSAVPARAQESGDKVHSKRPLRFKEERQAAARGAACPPLSASLSLSLSLPQSHVRALASNSRRAGASSHPAPLAARSRRACPEAALLCGGARRAWARWTLCRASRVE